MNIQTRVNIFKYARGVFPNYEVSKQNDLIKNKKKLLSDIAYVCDIDDDLMKFYKDEIYDLFINYLN